MRKIFFLFISVFSFSLAHAGDGYNIKGKVKGVKDTLIFLGNYYGDKQYLKDTAKVDGNGNFVFSGNETLPGGIYLVVTPRKSYFELIIDKEQNFSFETDTANFIKNMKLKGSQDNILFYQYLNKAISIQTSTDSLLKQLKEAKTKSDTTKVYDKVRDLNKDLNSYRENFAKEHPGFLLSKVFLALPDPEVPETPKNLHGEDSASFAYRYYKKHFLDNVDFSDNRMLRTPVFHGKMERYMTQLVVQVPDSINKEADALIARTKGDAEMYKYVVWWLTYHYETSKIMGLDAVFVHLVENYYQKKLCPWVADSTLKKMIDRASKIAPNLIGNVAPDLKMLSMYMQPISMSDIKSKYLVIVFWDPTCGHCKKEIPILDSLYRAAKDKYGFEVFAVNLDGNQQEWIDYVNEHHLEWINVWDPYNKSDFRKLYDIYSTPVIYLLDKDRKIVAKRIDTEQLGKVLDDLSVRDKSKLIDKSE